MTERVAKAMAGRTWPYLTEEHGGFDESGPSRNCFREWARAAIEAMMEPTEEMVGAGEDGVLGHYGGCCVPGDNRETALDTWQAMIDAALAEKDRAHVSAAMPVKRMP